MEKRISDLLARLQSMEQTKIVRSSTLSVLNIKRNYDIASARLSEFENLYPAPTKRSRTK